jgi:hypothetical protein
LWAEGSPRTGELRIESERYWGISRIRKERGTLNSGGSHMPHMPFT